jgi:hypothetical protein
MGPWLALASFGLLGSATALTGVPLVPSSAAVPVGVPARLLVLTTLVPGQRLKVGQDCWQEGLQIGEGAPASFWDLFGEEVPLVAVGRQGLSLHARGVEVCVEGDGVLAASGRIAEILYEGEDLGSRWAGRAGRVLWLGRLDDSDDALSPNDATDTVTTEQLQAVAAVVGELAREWEQLVRTGRERFPGHLDKVLCDLGPTPPASAPNALALWVAGLLNPHPALGVALEIRPAVLTARTTSRRLSMAKQGLEDSIKRLRRPGPVFELLRKHEDRGVVWS